ncbi:Remorin 4.1 [Bienertia sinuspersici]
MANNRLMTTRTHSGTFPSPDTPPSGEVGLSIGIPKGWSSERVPRSSYRSRRHVASAALLPFSSGRTLPSKWEDAERWICSPVSLGNHSISNNNNSNSNNSYCYYGTVDGAGSGSVSQVTQYQRHVKSKSGPMGPVGPGYYTGGYNSFSPVLGVGVINDGKWRNSLTKESSGLESARFEERLGFNGGGEGGRRSCPGHGETHWLDSWSGPPSPTQGEVNLGDGNNEANNVEEERYKDEAGVNRAISRRDMATQMYPENESQNSRPYSAISSPKSSTSAQSPRPLLYHEPEPKPKRRESRDIQIQSTEYEVRDVQVDKQASSTKSRSNVNVNNGREHGNSISTNNIEEGKQNSKIQREEARINAWENLQKAKAESAIQKLEEKLEKIRESSMSKIIQKLRRAEIKADNMRSSLSSASDKTNSQAISKTTSKIPSFCKKFRLHSSSKSCSTCYPF